MGAFVVSINRSTSRPYRRFCRPSFRREFPVADAPERLGNRAGGFRFGDGRLWHEATTTLRGTKSENGGTVRRGLSPGFRFRGFHVRSPCQKPSEAHGW